MTEEMARPLPQYVYAERTRHGSLALYFRKGKGPRTRLPDRSAADFEDKYHAALAGIAPKAKHIVGAGTLGWLIAQYRGSSAWLALSPATRKQREAIFRHVAAKAGHVNARAVTRKKIVEGREDRAATPHQARHFLDAMRGLFAWALEGEHIDEDPTLGVDNPARPRGGGFAAWSEDDVQAYERKWKAGTKERVWLHVLLYTGLRRGDAVRIGRQHVREGVATIKTEKTGMEVSIPILPMLEQTLKRGPTGDLAFIVGDKGEPLTKETFGNYYREACNAAGIKGKSAHGVRKIGATRAAEAGATVAELDALYGWTGGKMASYYTRNADRKRLAKSGSEKIMNATSPHLEGERPAPEKTSRKIKALRASK